MLTINVPERELFDDSLGEFIYVKAQTLVLEHSLVSVSKWESKWCKPFISKEEKTTEEVLDYIRCMTITTNVDPNVYRALSAKDISLINDYIESPMTATWFAEDKLKTKRYSREIITSELIYYWMVALQIPFECQKWHLNRLLTLIRICNIKNQPPKKMSKREILSRNRSLNAARRAASGSKG